MPFFLFHFHLCQGSENKEACRGEGHRSLDRRTWCKGSSCCSKLFNIPFRLPLGLISFRALGPGAVEDVVLALREKPMIGLGKKTCM